MIWKFWIHCYCVFFRTPFQQILSLLSTLSVYLAQQIVYRNQHISLIKEREGDLPLHSDPAIKSDTGLHSQFLQLFFFTFSYFECGRGCNTFHPIKFYNLPRKLKIGQNCHKFIMEQFGPCENMFLFSHIFQLVALCWNVWWELRGWSPAWDYLDKYCWLSTISVSS